MANPEAGIRLNRFLARAGLGSRRAVEDLVRQGLITINGELIKDLGRRVDPARDTVVCDGVPVCQPRDFRIYAFNKPLEVVCTLKAQGGQPSLLPYRLQADIQDRFVPVGRLDSESTGLLLWTDDGNLNQLLCRHNAGIWKTYQVELSGPLPPHRIATLTDGQISLDGRPCRPCRLELAPDQTTRHWVMQLQEGRRRQIRRMFSHIGLKVLHLHRTDIGPVKLGKLLAGNFRRLTHAEETALRQAADAGHRP